MSEIEVPLEQATEDMHHALHGGHEEHSSGMMGRAAVLSAFLAVFAAISALFAGHWESEAMLEQIQSSDQWALYQAKGIKLAIAEMRNDTNPDDKLVAKIEGYKKDQEEIKEKAKEKEDESREHLRKHQGLAAAVTLFQVAIAMTAISVLTKKKRFLAFAGVVALGGTLWMIKSFLF